VLENIFHELNCLHFEDSLPLPKLSWNARLASTAGRFCPGFRHPILPLPAEIEVAAYLRDLPDGYDHIRDTMLHEMIHYFLWHRKRPHGHTPEFHQIMKRVGAQRYNTVPRLRAVKYWYECQGCRKRVPARRKLRPSACYACCKKYSRGEFDNRFRLVMLADRPAPQAATLAPPPEKFPAPVDWLLPPVEEPRLPPSEVIRRLEELKAMLRRRVPARECGASRNSHFPHSRLYPRAHDRPKNF
jgi:predicted SprT family Zn-dependent metalloprotease